MASTSTQNDKMDTPLLQSFNEDNEKSAISKINKIIIPITFIMMLLIYIIRHTTTLAASALCENFNLTYSEFGFGIALFNISYTIFITPGGLILKKMKLYNAVSIVLVFSGLCFGLTAFAQNKYQFYILRFLMGISQAGIVPITFDYISRLFPAKYKLFAYAVSSSSPQFSGLFSSIVAMAFLSIDKAFGLDGWQWLIFIEGLVTALFSIVTFLFLPNEVQDLKQLTHDERNWILNNLDVKDEDEKADFKTSIINIIKNANFWFLTLSIGFRVMGFVGLGTFLTLIISEMLGNGENNQGGVYEETCADEANDAIAALLTVIPSIVTGIFNLLIGKYGKYVKSQTLYMSSVFVISSLFLLLWVLVRDYLIIGLFVLTLATAIGNSVYPFQMSIIDNSVDKKDKVLGISLNTTVALLGTIIGPILIGFVVDSFGFNGSIYFAIGCLLIAATLAFCIKIKNNN